ncbi:uncharacterized protein G2W53_008238 [Senna tora]|uniref:Uncharacterized protein n=1 Tax=Senna tora TaxID=362788 RepID=A0A835CEG8_9FABA|nr:uncharacterized protein G2W53_008238 [Senna tora]
MAAMIYNLHIGVVDVDPVINDEVLLSMVPLKEL